MPSVHGNWEGGKGYAWSNQAATGLEAHTWLTGSKNLSNCKVRTAQCARALDGTRRWVRFVLVPLRGSRDSSSSEKLLFFVLGDGEFRGPSPQGRRGERTLR